MNVSEWEEFELWAYRIDAERKKLPTWEQIAFIRDELAKADPRWKRAATSFFFGASEALELEKTRLQMDREDRQFERGRELRYFWAGVAGVLLCVVLVLFLPFTRQQVYVLQLIASLSAAALLAYMPGMLEVELRLKKANSWWGGKIRGTSAGAAFIIVWFLLPSLVQHPK